MAPEVSLENDHVTVEAAPRDAAAADRQWPVKKSLSLLALAPRLTGFVGSGSFQALRLISSRVPAAVKRNSPRRTTCRFHSGASQRLLCKQTFALIVRVEVTVRTPSFAALHF